MRLFTWLFFSIVILLSTAFACLNAEPVFLHYYLGTQKLPLSVLLIGALIMGLLLGYLFSVITILKLKIKLRHLS